MKYRDHYFKREATVNNSDTVIIDINLKDPVSQISIEYEATNGSTSCVDHEIHDDISSIELVDGSQVLWSLDMQQARALNFFELKQLPHELADETLSEKQEEKCYINFGRFLNDPEYYLDPTKYANLQLRLTHTLTIDATAGFATGTGKVTVMARVLEEGAKAYKGFLSAREKVSYTSGTSGDKEIQLPTDNPYRLMLLQARKTLLNHVEVISQYKLSVDADNYVPFSLYTEDIVDQNRSQFGLVTQHKKLFSADDGTALLDIYNIADCLVWTTEDDHIATLEKLDAEQISNSLYDFTTPGTGALQTTAKAVYVKATGLEPYGCVCIPFGCLDEPSDWFRSQDYGDIRLYATQVAVGACSVILQQLKV